jgi:hypothetical protein
VLSSESNAPPHVAMPKLMGAPAYARPPRPVEETPRPLTRDDLPIEAHRTDDEHNLAAEIGVDSAVLGIRPATRAEPGPNDESASDADAGKGRSIVARLGLRRG